ncbi:MAG TPA: PIN domain-containing protein [Candidatus Paceibacterota bacterium]|nr:PIN domain-containing protein [Verrucomicrobiota bacterium]HRZ47648.1 PIN domain-containing protein [Candidatus Paceibacterota bacterium]
MAPRYWVDTNVIVRFLTGQPPALAAAARSLVAMADTGAAILEVLPVIVAETVYTLESFYGMDRKDVAANLLLFLQSRGIQVHERERVLDALARHRDRNIHFADAYLAAAGADSGLPVVSFDRDLDKCKDVQRIEPTA